MLAALCQFKTTCLDGKLFPQALGRTFSFLVNDAALATKAGPFDEVELYFYMKAMSAVFLLSKMPQELAYSALASFLTSYADVG